MPVRCENCGSFLYETDRVCPVCGSSAGSFPYGGSDDAHDSLILCDNEVPVKRKRFRRISTVIIVVIVFALLTAAVFTCVSGSGFFGKRKYYKKDLGYYNYNNTVYYNQDGRWYQYDKALGWIIASPDDDFLDNYENYYEGRINEGDVSDFRKSEYYDPDAGLVERSDNGGGVNNQVGNDNNDFEGDGDW